VSPIGRVQGPSRELETDSRNYGGYFLGYSPLAAHLALSLLLLPLSDQFEIRDSCRLPKGTRALDTRAYICMCMYYSMCGNINKGQSIYFICIYLHKYIHVYVHIHIYICEQQGKERPRNR